VRRVEAAEPRNAPEQVVGDAVHDLPHLAVHVGVQAAEIRHPRGGSHAAEKAVALYQQRGPAGARGCDRGGDAGGTAAENDDFVFTYYRCGTSRLGKGGRRSQKLLSEPGMHRSMLPDL
jgi:hypothetical protein